MNDELSPIEKSRELVLSIRVQHALVEVEPINCHPLVLPVIEIHTSSSFATDKTFQTRDELIEWARDVATKLKFAIVIVNSNYCPDRRKQNLVLSCERDGIYKPTKKKLQFEETGTRKMQSRTSFYASKD
jgi:hypothetical protein